MSDDGTRPRIPRGTLSRTRIVETAIALLDREGWEAFSMPRLARELGTRPMSIYRHVTDKADLCGAISFHLIDTVPLPDPEAAGVAELAQVYRALWQLYKAHPWLINLVRVPGTPPPKALRFTETIYTILFRLGVPPEELLPLVGALANLVLGAALQQPHLIDTDTLAAQAEALPEEEYPSMRSLGPLMSDFSLDATLELGLARLLSPLSRSGESRDMA